MTCLTESMWAWQAAKSSDPLPSARAAARFSAALTLPAEGRRRGTLDPVFSLIVCDADDDRGLRQTLAALLCNDLSATQVIVATSRGREQDVARLLADLGGPTSIALQIADDADTFAEREGSALRRARGEFVGFLASGDLLAPNALALLGAVIAGAQTADILYTDEEWVDSQGARTFPRLKTGWDPDAQLGRDLFGRFCLLRCSRVAEAGGIHPEHAPAHQYDLHCRVAFAVDPSAIRHVPLVLSARAIPEADNLAENEDYAKAAREVARRTAERLCGAPVSVTPAPLAPFVNRIHWPLPVRLPLVSILVPTRDRADLVKNCLDGLLAKTVYANFEVLILDNDSIEPETFEVFAALSADPRVRVVPTPGPFNFSRINNEGVQQARGEIFVFLNNDIEILEGEWLGEMVSHALRPDVGCVGARLLYGDRHVQHAGIVLRPGPLAMHIFRRRPETAIGFDAQLAGVRSYAAVTAACLAVRRALFVAAGGFDETDLQVSFQDVDLCLKVEEMGYRNLCTPFEPLLHLEGSSRGADVTPENAAREQREIKFLANRWSDRLQDDKFAHPCIRLDWENSEELIPLPPGANMLDLVR